MAYCVYPLESPRWGDSNEHTQNTFMLKKNREDIPIMHPDLALWLTLVSSNNPCLEHIVMVQKVFEPLKVYCSLRGWSGGAMVLGELPVPGRPTIWITVGQGPTALAVGAGGGCLDIFTLIYLFSPLSPSLWETARYRLKYCLKGPLNPKQPTNQPTVVWIW